MSEIEITFPDGAVKEYPAGSSTLEVAKGISNSLAKKALAGKFNGELVDLVRPLEVDGALEIITPRQSSIGIATNHKDVTGFILKPEEL